MNSLVEQILVFMILIPGALLCYLPMRNQLKYSPLRTFLMSGVGLTLSILAAAGLILHADISTNTILMPSLVIFFLCFHHTLRVHIAKSLLVYTSVCAVMSFPLIFAYAYDAWKYPTATYRHFSAEACLFQLLIASIITLMLAIPNFKYYSWIVDHLHIPRVWYLSLVIPIAVVAMNILIIPKDYASLHVGRIFHIYITLEITLFLLLIFLFVLFYHISTNLLKYAKLEEEAKILSIEKSHYKSMRDNIAETMKLRHDFRHSVHALVVLSDHADLQSIRSHLHEYEQKLRSLDLDNYCANPLINAVLNYYLGLAKKKGIRTNIKIDLPKKLSITERELCSIIGNIIENGIDGCLSVPAKERFLSLSMEAYNQSFYIVATNSFDGKVKKKEGTYFSSKENGNGIGLVSIRDIVERYQGKAKISHTDTEFMVDLVMKGCV